MESTQEMSNRKDASVTKTFKRALENILARVFVSAPEADARSIAVAYSGGLDSSVLLHLAYAYAAERGMTLFAFHIHHGLSPNADVWLAHCSDACTHLDVSFDARKVKLVDTDKNGIEASARSARYAALGELCRQHKVPLLLTAHHQDDQVETVLLQMLRGAGLPGLSGMDVMNTAPELLGDASLLVARPLLSLPRTELAALALGNAIAHIEDESNQNTHHPRNALRNDVLPLLASHFPAFRECISRSAQHAESAQGLLNELAAQDLATCIDGGSIDVKRLQGFSNDRIDNLLRHWMAARGLRMPSTAWLHEARMQLLDARIGAQVCVTFGKDALRRYRDRIMLTSAIAGTVNPSPVVFRWDGEAQMPFPAYGGVLHFEYAEAGIDADWLRQQVLQLQLRAGSGQIKFAANRPTRSLKQHYQAGGVPAWERERLPLVYAGKNLLFAAGVGQDCRVPGASEGLHLHWQAY